MTAVKWAKTDAVWFVTEQTKDKGCSRHAASGSTVSLAVTAVAKARTMKTSCHNWAVGCEVLAWRSLITKLLFYCTEKLITDYSERRFNIMSAIAFRSGESIDYRLFRCTEPFRTLNRIRIGLRKLISSGFKCCLQDKCKMNAMELQIVDRFESSGSISRNDRKRLRK